MLEKLIELLKQSEKEYEKFANETSFLPDKARFTAERLIADGVEIPVHCCDCAKCITHIDEVGCPWLFCKRQQGRPVDPTDFCSYGERREGE